MWILSLFGLITLIFTYPLAFEIKWAVNDYGDPLLNIWVIAWDTRQLFSDPLNIFHANIFHPYANTLAFSEHLLGIVIFGLPLMLITKDPVLTHNFLILFSFILSGYGMYILSKELTGHTPGSIVAGVIYAFCPFRFGHMAHLQLLSMQWFPFAFLFLHRFFKNSRNMDLFFFAIFFILQSLSSGYYAIMISIFVICFILFFGLSQKEVFLRKYLKKLLITSISILIFLYPFFQPYLHVKKEHGFSREGKEIELYSADIASYLIGAGPGNRIYGSIAKRVERPENNVMIGFLPIILFIIGIVKAYHSFSLKKPIKSTLLIEFEKKTIKIFLIAVDTSIIILSILVLIVLISGGISFQIGPSHIKLYYIKDRIIAILILILLHLFFIHKRKKGFTATLWKRFIKFLYLCKERLIALPINVKFYFILTIFALLLSLGPKAYIYSILHYTIPGFDTMRVPARFASVGMLGIGILSGFAVKYMLGDIKKGIKKPIIYIILSLILLEYNYIPLSFKKVNKEIPPVYTWLKNEKDDFAIVELPVPERKETVILDLKYMYFSTIHWKKLVNGYSGFFPPDYEEKNRILSSFPSKKSIALMKRLRVKYVIIHFRKYYPADRLRILKEIERNNELRIIKIFDLDYVIEIVKSPSPPSKNLLNAHKGLKS